MAKVRAAGSERTAIPRKGTPKAPAKTPPKETKEPPKKAAPVAPAIEQPATAQKETIRCPAWVWPALLTLAPLAIFLQILGFPFLSWDDAPLITKNPWMHPATWASFVHSWHYPLLNIYAPLTHNLYELLVLVSHSTHPGQGLGLSPSVYHAASLLLHLGCVWLVWALLRRLKFPSYAAFLGALLFAVHPLAAEPVSWIGGMDTMLSSFLCLIALNLYTAYAQSDDGGKRRWLWLGLATLSYLLALFAKPGAVSLPVMALALELFVFKRPWRTYVGPLVGWVAIALGWVHVTQMTQHAPASIQIPYWQRPFVAGDSLAFYLVKLFLPFPEAMDYGRSPAHVLAHAWGYATWLLPAVLAIVAWRLYRSFPQLAAGYALMIAGTLPMLGFVPFIFQGTSTVSDRYMYLAMVGPALVLAGLATRLRPAALYGVFALLLVAGACCFIQVGVWRNSEALFRHAVAVNPRSAYAIDLLADVYMAKNDPATAVRDYRRAAEIDPTQGGYYFNLAIAYREMGSYADSIAAYQRSIALSPGNPKSYFGLGLAYAESGQMVPAARQWLIATQLDPNNPDYHYNLGLALLRLGLYNDSIQQFQAVLALQPGSPSAELRLSQAESAEHAGELQGHTDHSSR